MKIVNFTLVNQLTNGFGFAQNLGADQSGTSYRETMNVATRFGDLGYCIFGQTWRMRIEWG